MSSKDFSEKNVLREVISQHFLYLQDKYPYNCFNTDAPKSAPAVSCATHGPNFNRTKTVIINTSIFMAEARGILLAVAHIMKTKTQQSIVFMDSFSVVTALKTES